MDITKMTAAQRAELKAQLEAEERAEKQKREESIAAYKSSVDEFCRNKFSRLQALSEEMRPVCGILTQAPERSRAKPKPSAPMTTPECRMQSSPITQS